MDRTQRTERTVWAVTGTLLLFGLGLFGLRFVGGDEPVEAVVASASEPAAEESSEPGDDETSAMGPTATPQPIATATPTPTTSASPTPEPTATSTTASVDDQVAELRDSDMWLGLAEWDRAWPRGKQRFWWGSTSEDLNCQHGEFSNGEEVWNEFAPVLRDELLRMVVEEGVEPETVRYRGKPIQDDFVSGVLGWWTNGDRRVPGSRLDVHCPGVLRHC